MDPNSIIAARPHFRLDGSSLFFFLSDRVYHRLSPAELAVWQKLQEGPSAFRKLTDPGAVESLAELRLIEVIAPVPAVSRRRILVIEPHSDDAALSIGGTMWKMRNEVEFHLLTLASRSNYTSTFHLHRDYFNRSQVTAMRTAEGQLFMKHLGGHYHCAGLCEATLRYRDADWSLDFYNSHEVPIAISNNRKAGRKVLAEWTAKLAAFLTGREFDEVWIPLGAGTHSDHDLARNAALQLLTKTRPRSVIRIYEDVPYGADFQEHTDRILERLICAGARMTPSHQDVSEEFSTKLELLSIFASQFKVGSIETGIRRSAKGPNGDRKEERLWTIEALPPSVPEDEIWIREPETSKVSPEAARIQKTASSTRRVAIFAIGASGRWAKDLSDLGDLFPNAKFAIYAGPRVCAEFQEVESPRTRLHCLSGGSFSWIKAALGEFATGHRIVIAGDAMAKARRMTLFWPIGQTVVVSAMDDLMRALTTADNEIH